MNLNKVRKVGVIDSGKGGQLVASRIKKLWPGVETFQYIPDTFSSFSNMSLENLFISAYNHVEYLKEKEVDLIVIGCMTLSTNCLNFIKRISNVKVYDVYSNIGYLDQTYTVIATENSIKSGKFSQCIEIPCGHLSGAIQNKEDLNLNEEAFESLIGKLLKGFIASSKKTPTDKLILGCTHYPLATKEILKVFRDVQILDPIDNLLDKLDNLH